MQIKKKKWLSTTNIWCFWCCHSFNTPPISLPVSYTNNVFYVTGCYCSFECAVTHLFQKNNMYENEKWYSYNLLHILRNKLFNKPNFEKIQHAPAREILQVFGGNLTIEEFRNSCNTKNNYNILHPPIVSLIPTIEIVEKNNTSLLENIYKKGNKTITLDKKRLDKATENIKLKRKEPLIDKKKTLLHYMNLKFQKNE